MKKLLEKAFDAGQKQGQWIENGRNFNMEKPARFKEWYNTEVISNNYITQNDIDIIRFLHDRLVNVYEEDPNTDYLIKIRDIVEYLQQEFNIK